jgi:hypothetical protein
LGIPADMVTGIMIGTLATIAVERSKTIEQLDRELHQIHKLLNASAVERWAMIASHGLNAANAAKAAKP